MRTISELLQKVLGEKLYEFLTDNKPNKVLIINWLKFTPRQIVAINDLLNIERTVDGTLVPDDLIIISIATPDTYKGEDFTHRFEFRDTFHLSKTNNTSYTSLKLNTEIKGKASEENKCRKHRC